MANDTLDSGPGNDTLRGEAGNDTLSSSADADTDDGGAGDDTIMATPCFAVGPCDSGDRVLGGHGLRHR